MSSPRALSTSSDLRKSGVVGSTGPPARRTEPASPSLQAGAVEDVTQPDPGPERITHRAVVHWPPATPRADRPRPVPRALVHRRDLDLRQRREVVERDRERTVHFAADRDAVRARIDVLRDVAQMPAHEERVVRCVDALIEHGERRLELRRSRRQDEQRALLRKREQRPFTVREGQLDRIGKGSNRQRGGAECGDRPGQKRRRPNLPHEDLFSTQAPAFQAFRAFPRGPVRLTILRIPIGCRHDTGIRRGRRARRGPGDIAAIRAIYNQGIADRVATLDEEPKSAADITAWWADHDGRYAVVVAERDGVTVGWCSLNRYSHRCGTTASSTCRCTSRGKRANRRRLRAARRRRSARSPKRLLQIVLSRSLQRERQALYRKTGFREVGVFRNQGRLDGRFVDVMAMEKLL